MTMSIPAQTERASGHPCGRVFADPAWQRAWTRGTTEALLEHRPVGPAGIPLLRLGGSPFWRGYEVDAGGEHVLDFPAAFLSTLYAVSSPLNQLTPAEARLTVEEARGVAKDWGVPVLAVPNLEPGPVLTALTEDADALVRLDATNRIELGPDLDSYLAGLGRSRRTDLRRRHRRATERGVTFHRRTGQDARARLEEYLGLTGDSAEKHDIPPLYDEATLRELTSVPGAELLTSEHESQLLAGILAFRAGDAVVFWSGGIRYSVLKEYHQYVFLLYEAIAALTAEGVRFLDFGRGNLDFKGQYGFHPTELLTTFHLLGDQPGLAGRLRRMHEGIAHFLQLPT
jgi:hypothetical protein